MGQAINKRQIKGQGFCSTPKCQHVKTEGSLFCKACKKRLAKIRKEFVDDPRSLYNQRSDNPNRKKLAEGKYQSKQTKLKSCRHIGCYEMRIPPSPYCFAHEGEESDHD